MNKLILISTLLLWVSQTAMAQKPAEPLPLKIEHLDSMTMTEAELSSNVDALNTYIGSYPTNIENAAQRQQVYEFWSKQVAEAEAFARLNPNTENAFSLRSELYRQGHNLDVAGSADRARENLTLCFEKFENPISCHFSASYFYLSINPEFADKAKPSLDSLRQHFGENHNSDVDRGFVFYFLMKNDLENAVKEAKGFLKNHPDYDDTALFDMLVNSKVEVKTKVVDGPNQ